MQHEDIVKAPRGAIWAAGAFSAALDFSAEAFRRIQLLLRPIPTKPDDCITPSELRAYAERIRHSQPSLSADLIAAANRHEDGQ